MRKLLRRVRAALVLGVTWALAWGGVGGLIMEGIFDRHGRILDMWPQTLAIPGFLGGVLFSVVLWATEGRRHFEELSVGRAAAWGALAGLVLCGVAISILGFSTFTRAALIVAPVTLLTSISAAGSIALARKAKRPELVDVRAEAPDQLP